MERVKTKYYPNKQVKDIKAKFNTKLMVKNSIQNRNPSSKTCSRLSSRASPSQQSLTGALHLFIDKQHTYIH